MEKLFKYIIFFIVTIIFVGCVAYTPIYKVQQKDISVKINTDKYYKLPIKKEDLKRYFSPCVSNSLFFNKNTKTDSFTLDYIKLQMGCEWSGFSKSEYLSHLTDSNKINSLNFIEKYENDKIDITKYKTDTGCYFYLIGVYGLDEHIFIVDKTANISKNIFKRLGIDKELSIEKKCTDNDLKLKDGIVKNNFFFQYFKKEERENKFQWLLNR